MNKVVAAAEVHELLIFTSFLLLHIEYGLSSLYKCFPMRIRLIVCIAFLFASVPAIQAQDSLPREKKYALVVQFHSICCGVPDDAPLQKAIRSFRKKYKTRKIHADKIGPMGKEGEYYLAFTLKELTVKQRRLFIKKVEAVVPVMKDRGQASTEKNLTIRKEDYPARVTLVKVNW